MIEYVTSDLSMQWMLHIQTNKLTMNDLVKWPTAEMKQQRSEVCGYKCRQLFNSGFNETEKKTIE